MPEPPADSWNSDKFYFSCTRRHRLPGVHIFTHFRSMGGRGDTPAAKPGLFRRGGAGLGGVRCLCLPHPHLGGVCSPSVFFKVCLGLSERHSTCPGNSRQQPGKCSGTTRPSAGRSFALFPTSFDWKFLSLVFLTWATRCGMFSSAMRRALTVRTHAISVYCRGGFY